MCIDLGFARLLHPQHQRPDQVGFHLGDLLGVAQLGDCHGHRHAGDEAIVV